MKILLLILVSALAYGQELINGSRVIAGTVNYCEPSGGTDSYGCTIPGLPAYATGGLYSFKADVINTGTANVNFTSLGAKTIVKVAGGITTTLVDGDIKAGQVVDLKYDGTNMQMQSTLGNAPTGFDPAATHTITGTWNAAGATRTAPAKSGTSLPGTCTVGDEYNKTDATAEAMKYICTATNTWTQQTGSGGTLLTSNAGDALFWPTVPPTGVTTNRTLTANTFYADAFMNPVSQQFRNMLFYLGTVAAAGKGIRGFVATRNSSGNLAIIARTDGLLVDSGAGGMKSLPFSSGSAVSGGVLTLPAGQNYYIGVVTDGAPFISQSSEASNVSVLYAYLYWDGSAYTKKGMVHGTAGVSGAGTAVDVSSPIAVADQTASSGRGLNTLILAP